MIGEMTYLDSTSMRVGMIVLALVLGYIVGLLHGIWFGRKKEANEWSQDVGPMIKQLKNERNQLWRSAVAKTQKLNRIAREMKRR